MARGYTNSEIARAIHLSEGTIRNYISSIFVKLNVPDRTQAALMALRYGLVHWSQVKPPKDLSIEKVYPVYWGQRCF